MRLLQAAVRWLLVVSSLGAAAPALAQSTTESVRREGGTGRLELGTMFGAHIFADDLELGVVDEPMDSTSPENMVLLGLRLGFAFHDRFTLEGEVGVVPAKDRYYDQDVIVVGARVHGLFYLAGPSSRVRPFLLAGAGTLAVAGDGIDGNMVQNDADFVSHWGLGLRIRLMPNLGVRLDGRHLIVPDTSDGGMSNDFEFSIGLAIAFGSRASTTRTIVVEPEVIVAKPVDSDGDFLTDDKDGCPKDPEDVDGFQDTDGCPEIDNDKDGLDDNRDGCPDEAEVKNGVDDEDGCPEVDSDKDGLIGSRDKCPDQPEDLDSWQDDDGCPDPDNDGDGVEDAADKCAKELETKNGFQDSDGCPDELPKEVKKFTGVIAGINFKRASAEIQKNSFKLLDRAVKVLNDYPDLKIEISGHTSDEGERNFNVELSLQRANAVKTYLVNAGIAPERIITVGKGPDEPIAQGKSKRAREKNRRIEFRLITE